MVAATMASKVKCLKEHGRDTFEPIYGLKYDEEYWPTFKDCVKTNLSAYTQYRNERIQNGTLKGMIAPEDEKTQSKILEFSLDQVMLKEL